MTLGNQVAAINAATLARKAATVIGASVLDSVCSTLDQAAAFRALSREADAGEKLAAAIEHAIVQYGRELLAPSEKGY